MAKNALFDTMVLVPEYEYAMLKEKNKEQPLELKSEAKPLQKTVKNMPQGFLPTAIMSLPPGVPEKSLNNTASKPNTIKAAISTNWNALWEPL